ncbi:hypothetical protein [Actinosynnema mirum]|uniref:hypothetical protein n=1 Tax=Actinosynnema mirum TaxID=40567 RepID=UPI000320DD66|nr:hypothetical protein [Actinosynnema mirum]
MATSLRSLVWSGGAMPRMLPGGDGTGRSLGSARNAENSGSESSRSGWLNG